MGFGESRSGNNDTTRHRLQEREGEEEGREREIERDWQLHAARRFFASSMSGSKALYSARFLSTRWIDTRQKRRNAVCLCTCSTAFLSSAFVRPSFVPPLHMRRKRVTRRVMHIFLNRLGNCMFNISELFSQRERTYNARFSERVRGRFCPPPFTVHLSSCVRCLFVMHRSKVAKRVHISDPSISPPLSFFLVRTHMRFVLLAAIFCLWARVSL